MNLVIYKLKDFCVEEIIGNFYEFEFFSVKQDVFMIEKVIWRDYKKKKVLVKWLGYSDDFNLWVLLKDFKVIQLYNIWNQMNIVMKQNLIFWNYVINLIGWKVVVIFVMKLIGYRVVVIFVMRCKLVVVIGYLVILIGYGVV